MLRCDVSRGQGVGGADLRAVLLKSSFNWNLSLLHLLFNNHGAPDTERSVELQLTSDL